MECFWDNFVECYDPACGGPPPVLYFNPGGASLATTPGIFTDAAMTIAAPTLTSAVVTRVLQFAAPSADCCCGCWAVAWADNGSGGCTNVPHRSTTGSAAPPHGVLESTHDSLGHSLSGAATLHSDYSELSAYVKSLFGSPTYIYGVYVVSIETSAGSGILVYTDDAVGCI